MAAGKASEGRAITPSSAAGVVRLCGGVAVLGAIFALIMALHDRAEDARRGQWPTAQATFESARVDRTRSRRSGTSWRIRCLVRYRVNGEPFHASLYSHSMSARAYVETMESWVAARHPGGAILLRYDPKNPREVVPVEGQLPYTGSHQRDDVVNAGIFGTVGVALLFVARLMP